MWKPNFRDVARMSKGVVRMKDAYTKWLLTIHVYY